MFKYICEVEQTKYSVKEREMLTQQLDANKLIWTLTKWKQQPEERKRKRNDEDTNDDDDDDNDDVNGQQVYIRCN